MSIKLRWKEYPSGRSTAYLDIYKKGGSRKYIFTDIHIENNDPGTIKKSKRTQAELYRAKYEEAFLNGLVGLLPSTKQNKSFIQYYQAFLDDFQNTGKRKYEASFEKFKIYLNKKDITFSELDHIKIQGFADYLYSKNLNLSGETPYDYFKRFKAIINTAYKDGYFLKNPSEHVKAKKPKSRIIKDILTEEEIQKLANTECSNKEVKRAFLLACFTGLGEKEIKSLTWMNIKNGRINIKRAKNDQVINNKLNSTALNLLGSTGSKEEYIFTLPSNTAIRKQLKNWLAKAKIDKHITFYCGRHTFAVLLLMKGANLKSVSDALGHTDSTHTYKYLNYVEALKDDAIDNLPDINL